MFSQRPSRESHHSSTLCVTICWATLLSSIVEVDIGTGQHRNPTNEILYFTDAFFHQPAEIRTEMEDAGFETVAQLPIEGLGVLAGDFDSLWSDPPKRNRLLELLSRTESIEELTCASAHCMSIGMKR
jgi:hypothetical protein